MTAEREAVVMIFIHGIKKPLPRDLQGMLCVIATARMSRSADRGLLRLKRSGNKMIVTFDCSGGLTVMPKNRYADKQTDEKIKKENIDTSVPMEFEIAGGDRKFEKASAVIDGNNVILTSANVKAPVYVRYAWGAYPEMPNLTDSTGLPTATFTTEFASSAGKNTKKK